MLSMFLMGCSGPSAVVKIDGRLTAPCYAPKLAGKTNRDVWVYAYEERQARIECSERMQIIRELTQ